MRYFLMFSFLLTKNFKMYGISIYLNRLYNHFQRQLNHGETDTPLTLLTYWTFLPSIMLRMRSWRTSKFPITRYFTITCRTSSSQHPDISSNMVNVPVNVRASFSLQTKLTWRVLPNSLNFNKMIDFDCLITIIHTLLKNKES